MKTFSLILALALFSTAAQARHHHRHALSHESAHASHLALNVVSYASERFRGLANEFRSMGYAIGNPGCLSSGHMRHSKHHWGGACDLFDQVARNRTRLPQPPPSVQIAVANRHLLVSGCVWRHPDCGHFEVAGR